MHDLFYISGCFLFLVCCGDLFQCAFCALCVVQVCFVLEGSVILLISVLASYSLFQGVAYCCCVVQDFH